MIPIDQKRQLEHVLGLWSNKGEGAYVMFDGQFGSTGKGLFASLIGELLPYEFSVFTNNAGPNSGHTAYYGNTKIVLQQLPMAGVIAHMRGAGPHILLNAGAVVSIDQLRNEIGDWLAGEQKTKIVVHNNASYISPTERSADGTNVVRVGSTGKGVGPALQRKLSRGEIDVFGQAYSDGVTFVVEHVPYNPRHKYFVEVSQGWSLGINQEFYPYVTTRECGVSQALSDLGAPPQACKGSIACLRTFPIRVANPPKGSSGGCYPDQREIDWESLGVEPERTTVTGNIRRVFTWSDTQYRRMLEANRPNGIFINFMNYLVDNGSNGEFLGNLLVQYRQVMGTSPEFILGGYGPRTEDIKVLYAKHSLAS